MTRGFLIGATAGRTTLTGEGLQHADGHSPAARLDEPGGRVLRPGLRVRDRAHRPGRAAPDVRRQPRRTSSTTSPSTTSRWSSPRSRRTSTSRASCAGCTCCRRRRPTAGSTSRRGRSCSRPASACRGRSRRSSCSPRTSGVAADVWSVTSWSELRRDGMDCDEQEFLRPEGEPAGAVGDPEAAGRTGARCSRVSDYMRGVQDQIAQYVPGDFMSARRRRVRLLRHPAGGAPLLPHRRPVARRADAPAAGQAGRGPAPTTPPRPPRSTASTT